MVLKPCTQLFLSSVLTLAILKLAFGLKLKKDLKSSDMDQYMVEDQRTRTRQSYLVQRPMDNEVVEDINVVAYPRDRSIERNRPEELPALIVDYANLIRNDIILLDNSVETRTHKRGNIKVEKHSTIPELPCICEHGREILTMGENYFPPVIETRVCKKDKCPRDYVCKENYYNMTFLVRKFEAEDFRIVQFDETSDLPADLRRNWVAIKHPIVVGCLCTSTFVQPIH